MPVFQSLSLTATVWGSPRAACFLRKPLHQTTYDSVSAPLQCARCAALSSVEKLNKARCVGQPPASPLEPALSGQGGGGGAQCPRVGRVTLTEDECRLEEGLGLADSHVSLSAWSRLTAGRGLLFARAGWLSSCWPWVPTPGAGPRTGVCDSVVAEGQLPGRAGVWDLRERGPRSP